MLSPLLVAFEARGHRVVRHESAPKRDHRDEHSDAAEDRQAGLVERPDEPAHQAMEEGEAHISNFAIFCMT